MRKPVPIFFNENKFNDELKKFEQKLNLEADIDKEANRLLKTENVTLNDKTNSVDEFYKLVETINKDKNPMQLPGSKLIELFGLECINLDVLQKNYNKFKGVEKPLTDDYTIFATTPDELKRYDLTVNLIQAIEKLHPFFINKYGSVPLFQLRKLFNGALDVNEPLQVLTPCINYIKTGN